MKPRKIKESIYFVGAVDWDRRLFDSLVPLPDGTSYNTYLIRGSEKTALLDTVDPSMMDVLLSQLESVQNVDYVVSHHAEQDHSGAIPHVLEKYKNARVIATPLGKKMLMDHLPVPEKKFITVKDGETLSSAKGFPRRTTLRHSIGWPRPLRRNTEIMASLSFSVFETKNVRLC